MKKILLAAFLSASIFSHAQLSAFINGKEVKAGATVSKKDLASLQVSFRNPKKMTVISGASVLYVQLLDSNKKDIQMFFLQKEGYIAIEDFLKSNTAKKLKVFGENGFPNRANTLDWILSSAQGNETQKTIQVKVGFYVVQETGYKEYGPQVQLLEPLVFNVPVWDARNLTLPFIDVSLDKTNVKGDIETSQDGSTNDEKTTVGYKLGEYKKWYSVFALSSDKHPGLNAKEVAEDFIHAATLYANYNNLINQKTPFRDYDIKKFTLNWDLINDLLDEKFRISQLSYRVNKAAKNGDLMGMYEKVNINGLNGYMFKSKTEWRSDINANDWKDKGNFIIYILEHPTNPKLTLVVSSSLNDVDNTLEETDALLKNFINGIKK